MTDIIPLIHEDKETGVFRTFAGTIGKSTLWIVGSPRLKLSPIISQLGKILSVVDSGVADYTLYYAACDAPLIEEDTVLDFRYWTQFGPVDFRASKHLGRGVFYVVPTACIREQLEK